MTPLEAKRKRQLVQSELVTGSHIGNFVLRKSDWRGLLFDNYRYYDTYSGQISDMDFELISSTARYLYDDQDIVLVTAERFDSTHGGTTEPLPDVRTSANTLEGYSQFKREPGFFEFYMFGNSLKWVIYSNSDWSVVAGEPQFFDTLIYKYGGLELYLEKFDKELGLPDPAKEMTETAKEWLDFVIRILRITQEDLRRYFAEQSEKT